MTTRQIALRLIKLCKEQKFSTARTELYAEKAVSIEAGNTPISGLKAIEKKEKKWRENIQEIHDIRFSKPLINGNFFSIAIRWDITYKGRERGGWNEIAEFEVKNQKIVLEKFYY